jgi:hypothetical protein
VLILLVALYLCLSIFDDFDCVFPSSSSIACEFDANKRNSQSILRLQKLVFKISVIKKVAAPHQQSVYNVSNNQETGFVSGVRVARTDKNQSRIS